MSRLSGFVMSRLGGFERARLQRLLKNSCFVSGHDFSRAESASFAVGFSPWLSLYSLQSDFSAPSSAAP
jgi:hypothetical protein